MAPVTGTVANGGFSNDTTPTLAGTAEANSTVTIFDGLTQLGTVTANGSGAWTFTTAALAQGSHSFTATATDAAGSTGAASSAYSISIDTAAPAAPSITSVTDDVAPVTGTVASGGFSNDTTPTLAGTAEANSTVTIFDGLTQLGTATANGSGGWTFTPARWRRQPQLHGDGNRCGRQHRCGLERLQHRHRHRGAWGCDHQRGRSRRPGRQTITGTGEAGTTVTFFDNDSAAALGTAIVQSNGSWSTLVTLSSNGSNRS